MLNQESRASIEAQVSGLREALSYEGPKVIDEGLFPWRKPARCTSHTELDALDRTSAFLKRLNGLDFSSAFFSPIFARELREEFVRVHREFLHGDRKQEMDSNGLRFSMHKYDKSTAVHKHEAQVRYLEALRGFKREVGKRVLHKDTAPHPLYFDIAQRAFDFAHGYSEGQLNARMFSPERDFFNFATSLSIGRDAVLISANPYFEIMAGYVTDRAEFLALQTKLKVNPPVVVCPENPSYSLPRTKEQSTDSARKYLALVS